jgi:hypothetical protein
MSMMSEPTVLTADPDARVPDPHARILAQPTAPDPAWDEAYLRVESYLRAHQIESRILLHDLTADIVREARERASGGEAGLEPTVLAMGVANERIAAWFDHVLGDPGESIGRLTVRGRLALTMADVPGRWPHYFLRPDADSPELKAAMQAAYLEAGPELQFSNMVPRPIDLGPIANVAGETWKTFKRWPALRAATGWALIVGLLAAAWVSTR